MAANAFHEPKRDGGPALQFADNRPESLARVELQALANDSPQTRKTAQLQAMADDYSASQPNPIQKKENKTGLPDTLKSGIESLSGISMDDARVHYNSSKPAQLHALAYAQGTDIHLRSGQEKHLPHESWHVVQQKQGRVRPTMQMKDGISVNDDAGLENDADVMGAKALQMGEAATQRKVREAAGNAGPVAQCYGSIRWTNLDDQKPKYREKGQEILGILTASPVIQHYLRNKNAIVTLEFDGVNLASVTERGDQVRIALSPWFFEQESRGRIVGMLAHEFGVHPLADDRMTPGSLAAESATFDPLGPGSIPTGVGTDTLSVDPGNQRDHLFAAVQGFPRFNEYRRTVHDLVSEMLAQQATTHISNAHITDAIMSYLADLATILATNDHRGRVVRDPGRSAAYFTHVRTNWLTWLAGGNDPTGQITALTPPNQTGGSVIKEVGKLIGSFSLSLFTKSKSNRKYQQSTLPTGALADTTTIQGEVIGDYGWAVQPIAFGGPDPGFVEAVEQAAGLPHNTLATALQTNLATVHPMTPDQQDLDNRLHQIVTGNNKGLLPDTIIATFATEFNHTIRILRPDGKIDTFGTATLLPMLVQVPHPQPHYRFAQ